jgi:hypothetical protein
MFAFTATVTASAAIYMHEGCSRKRRKIYIKIQYKVKYVKYESAKAPKAI